MYLDAKMQQAATGLTEVFWGWNTKKKVCIGYSEFKKKQLASYLKYQ